MRSLTRQDQNIIPVLRFLVINIKNKVSSSGCSSRRNQPAYSNISKRPKILLITNSAFQPFLFSTRSHPSFHYIYFHCFAMFHYFFHAYICPIIFSLPTCMFWSGNALGCSVTVGVCCVSGVPSVLADRHSSPQGKPTTDSISASRAACRVNGSVRIKCHDLLTNPPFQSCKPSHSQLNRELRTLLNFCRQFQ